MSRFGTITATDVREAMPERSWVRIMGVCARFNDATRHANIHSLIDDNVRRFERKKAEAEWRATFTPGKRWLTLYHEDRAYGGPEEGGWWYTYGTVSTTYQVDARDFREEYWRLHFACHTANHGKPDIGSVLSQGRMRLVVSKRKGRDYPEERPYYC